MFIQVASQYGAILVFAVAIYCYASTGLDDGKVQKLFNLKGGYAGKISDYELSVSESPTGNKLSVMNGDFNFTVNDDVLSYMQYPQEAKILLHDQELAVIFKNESKSILKFQDILTADNGDGVYTLVSFAGFPEIHFGINTTTDTKKPSSSEGSKTGGRKPFNFWGLSRLLEGEEKIIFDNCLQCTSTGCAAMDVMKGKSCSVSSKKISSKDGMKSTTVITEVESGTALGYFSKGQIYLVTDDHELAKGAMLGDSSRIVQKWKRNQCRAVQIEFKSSSVIQPSSQTVPITSIATPPLPNVSTSTNISAISQSSSPEPVSTSSSITAISQSSSLEPVPTSSSIAAISQSLSPDHLSKKSTPVSSESRPTTGASIPISKRIGLILNLHSTSQLNGDSKLGHIENKNSRGTMAYVVPAICLFIVGLHNFFFGSMYLSRSYAVIGVSAGGLISWLVIHALSSIIWANNYTATRFWLQIVLCLPLSVFLGWYMSKRSARVALLLVALMNGFFIGFQVLTLFNNLMIANGAWFRWIFACVPMVITVPIVTTYDSRIRTHFTSILAAYHIMLAIGLSFRDGMAPALGNIFGRPSIDAPNLHKPVYLICLAETAFVAAVIFLGYHTNKWINYKNPKFYEGDAHEHSINSPKSDLEAF